MSAAVEIRNLSYRYVDGIDALNDVTIRIDAGECVGIIGANGAGKSTLLQHLNGLLPDDLDGEGPISIFGQAITKKNLPDIRRQVGLVFQDPNDQLFCPTVFEDVAFGPRQLGMSEAEVTSRVERRLKQLGLEGFESRLPHQLSLGERKRVCLAGVLACDPAVLVLDEPTSGLDPRGRREFKSILKSLDVTKILATHDLEMVVELCPRVIVLNRGRIVAAGATREILNDEPLMLANGLERPHVLKHHHPHE